MESNVIEAGPLAQPEPMTVEGVGRSVSMAHERNILPTAMDNLEVAAKMLAGAGAAVPAHFQGQQGLCLAVCFLAADWKMSPLAVAQKTYVMTKDGKQTLGFEAQLVNSLINLRAPLIGRLRPTYHGEGLKRFVEIRGRLRGEPEELPLVTPTFDRIKVKNSPLWFTDPDQQFYYYGSRAWARRYCPESILGAYTRDELEAYGFASSEARAAPFDPHAVITHDGPAMRWDRPVEPSGGASWALGKGSGDNDGEDRRGGGRQQAKPKQQPKADQPDGMDGVKAWLDKAKAAALAEQDPVKVKAGLETLREQKNFKRVVAYDQPYAKAVERAVEDHIARLEDKP